MEFTLWNLNAPGFWGSSGSSCHAADTVAQVLCSSNSDDIQADGVSYSISTTSSPCQDSPYQSTVDSEFITVKADSDMDKDHPDCLVTLELETDLEGSALEPDLDIKEECDFAVSRRKIQIGEDDDDGESSDTGQAGGRSVLPSVDNLWNNSVVAANVNVKTEKATYNIDDFAHHLFGRLPAKSIDSLSVGSEDEHMKEDAEEESDEDGQEEDEDEEEEEDEDEVPEEEPVVHARSAPRGNMRNRVAGYDCGECSFRAETRPGLKKHIATMHPHPAQTEADADALMRRLPHASASGHWDCPLVSCRYRSPDRPEMEAHVARHVASGAIAPLPASSKKTAPLNLQRVRYEREEYRCHLCSYSCTIEKAFYKHLKLHSIGASASSASSAASSKISCVVCGKDRPTEVDMNKHMRKHRDNRYFCCDICVFRTVQLKKLIQHRRMHTGEKPHLCPHCPYRSARRDNLRSHVRRVHKKENLYCDTFSPRGVAQSTTSV